MSRCWQPPPVAPVGQHGGRTYWTPLGLVLAADPVEGRRQVVEAVEEAGGNLTRAAWALGVSRMTLWRALYAHGLWPVVARVRADLRARRLR